MNGKNMKSMKASILTRIHELEAAGPVYQTQPAPQPVRRQADSRMVQSPSTLAALSKHPDIARQLGVEVPAELPVQAPAPKPVEHVAQTAVTQAALQARNSLIAEALSEEGVHPVGAGRGVRGAAKFRGNPT